MGVSLVTVCWEEAKDPLSCVSMASFISVPVYDKLDECGGEPEWEHIHI